MIYFVQADRNIPIYFILFMNGKSKHLDLLGCFYLLNKEIC